MSLLSCIYSILLVHIHWLVNYKIEGAFDIFFSLLLLPSSTAWPPCQLDRHFLWQPRILQPQDLWCPRSFEMEISVTQYMHGFFLTSLGLFIKSERLSWCTLHKINSPSSLSCTTLCFSTFHYPHLTFLFLILSFDYRLYEEKKKFVLKPHILLFPLQKRRNDKEVCNISRIANSASLDYNRWKFF